MRAKLKTRKYRCYRIKFKMKLGILIKSTFKSLNKKQSSKNYKKLKIWTMKKRRLSNKKKTFMLKEGQKRQKCRKMNRKRMDKQKPKCDQLGTNLTLRPSTIWTKLFSLDLVRHSMMWEVTLQFYRASLNPSPSFRRYV